MFPTEFSVPRALTVVLDRQGRRVLRAPGPGDRELLTTAAIEMAIEWARQGEVPAVSFLWFDGPRAGGRRVTAHLDYELAGSQLVTVNVEPLASNPYDLTFRELEVLTLLVAGLKNSDIAERVTISARTVATHVDRIMVKMGVPSRTAAATIALDEGLLVVPPPGGDAGFERLGLGRALNAFERRPETIQPLAPSKRLVRQPLRLGAALPLHGETAEDGLEMLRGAQLAVDEINSRGGINRRPIELVVAKLDHMDASTIRPAFDELADAEVQGVTSGYLARQDLAHEWAAEFGRPYLNAATLSQMVRRVEDEPRYRNIFQVCPGDSHYAPRFVHFMTELRDRRRVRFGSKVLAVLIPEWPLIDLGLEQAAQAADAENWQIETLPLGATPAEWTTAAEAVRLASPAAVLIGDYFVSATAGFLIKVLHSPPPTLFYSLYAPSIPGFKSRLRDAAEGLLWATVSGTYSDAPAVQFAQRYVKAYHRPPGRSHAGISYDRVHILATAWSRAPDPRDFEAVASEIRRLVHRGVNGSYWLGQSGQAALSYPDATPDPSLGQAHLIYQIQDGRHRIISPAPYSESPFRRPSWMLP